MANSRKKPSGRNTRLILKIGVLCAAFYAVISLVQLQTQIADKAAEVRALDNQIEESRSDNDALRKQVEEGISDDEIAAIARNQYGYIMPNERVFVDSSSR
ncbi:MAG: septum formation initiator family protein [Clostridiales bacterium]|nr:septum formation initiator family protein [Clostridiales bacterium]